MRTGGLVYVRDYAVGDLAENNLEQRADQRCISDHFYLRGDGTRAYYFSKVVHLLGCMLKLYQGHRHAYRWSTSHG